MKTIAKLAAFIMLAVSASAAHACITMHMEPSSQFIATATIAFRGKLLELTKIDDQRAKVRFVVMETFRGEKRAEWTLIWASGGITDAAEFRSVYGAETLVGAVGPASPAAAADLADLSHYPWVAQPACDPPVMIAWAPDGPNGRFTYFARLLGVPDLPVK